MSKAFQKGVLGRTELELGRLGVAASYGAPAEAFEEAFEKGCNYFYYGSGRRRAGMHQAIRNICGQGQRDKLIIAIQTYARLGLLTEKFFQKTLRALKIDRADVFILGWHNRPPSKMLIDRVLALKEKGFFRFLGISGHNRSLFPQMANEAFFDVFHIRYNAAHRGAENDAFPYLTGARRPGIVTYTATRWGQLLNPKKMPAGQPPLTAGDCYRFALSNPTVDICLVGPKNISEMREALSALELGTLGEQDMERVKRIGNHVRQKSKSLFG